MLHQAFESILKIEVGFGGGMVGVDFFQLKDLGVELIGTSAIYTLSSQKTQGWVHSF